jgi:signal peptidase II
MTSKKKIFFIVLFIVIFDQATKLAVKGFEINLFGINIYHQGLYLGESISVIGDFFKLTFIENPGIAFGLKVEGVWKAYLSIFTIISVFVIIYFLYRMKNNSFYKNLPLAIILGGAIGNMIDRVFYGVAYGYAPLLYGSVVDFLDFDFFDFKIFGRTYDRFPIFNIADMAVTIGVFFLLFVDLDSKKEEENMQLKIEAGNKIDIKIDNSSIIQTSENISNEIDSEKENK